MSEVVSNPKQQTWWQRRGRAEKIGIAVVGAFVGVELLLI